MSVFCSGLLRRAVHSVSTTGWTEIQFGVNIVREVTFPLCGHIPVYLRDETTSLVAAGIVHASESRSFRIVWSGSFLASVFNLILCVQNLSDIDFLITTLQHKIICILLDYHYHHHHHHYSSNTLKYALASTRILQYPFLSLVFILKFLKIICSMSWKKTSISPTTGLLLFFPHLDYKSEISTSFTVAIAYLMYCPPIPARLQKYSNDWLYVKRVQRANFV